MSTTNEALTTAWEKIAENTESFILTVIGESPVEIAFMTSDASGNPTVTGHLVLPNRDRIIRTSSFSNCAPGYVYVKTATGSSVSELALDVWTP